MSGRNLKGVELNQTINNYSSVGDLFFGAAQRFGDRICQIDITTGKTETYSSVKQRSTRVAVELQKQGITSKDVIVFCAKVTMDTIIPLLGSFYLGTKVANLDPILSVRQTTHLLSLVTPTMIFVEEASVGLIEESLKKAKFKPKIVVYGQSKTYPTLNDFLKPQPEESQFKPVKVDMDDSIAIFFSSGTTGLPKAICHTHSSWLFVVFSGFQSAGTCDSVLYFTSFYWISGLLLLSFAYISGGQRLFGSTVDAEIIFDAIEKYKVTYMFLAPILTYKLTSLEGYERYDTSSLKSLLVGGTPLSGVQFQRLCEVFKDSTILFGYGLTEAGIVLLFDAIDDRDLIKKKIGSSGKPAPGVIIKVVDLQTQEALGPNQKGEICVKSPGVMKGYLNANASAVFDEDGFLKTGDIGYYDEDKCFYVIERLKEMFKYMSWQIIPSSIEAVLLEHPAVKEAVVFGVPKSEEEGDLPAACVILKENYKHVSKNAIENFVSERVADFEKLRGGVVVVDTLQKTPSGKMMRQEIRKAMLSSFPNL